MIAASTGGFPPGVEARLQSYVYLLVDPRTGRPFAVGRGKGRRCFTHVLASRSASTPERAFAALDRIAAVEQSGGSVRIEILRYGLKPSEAKVVEAAAYDLLGLNDRSDLETQRQEVSALSAALAKRARFKPAHRVVLLCSRDGTAASGYHEVRHGWRIGQRWADPTSPRSPQWAVVVSGHLVRAVYRVERWEPTLSAGSPVTPIGGRSTAGSVIDRRSFVGERDPELERRYVGRSVAAYLGRASSGQPVYVWCGPHWVNTAQ